jgi:imidazole glycerol phosphate synthase subunit HisF
VYGKQAVVVSIDPRRVYVADPDDTTHTCVKASQPGPNGERWCWWQCTVKGGREGRDIDAVQVCVWLGEGWKGSEGACGTSIGLSAEAASCVSKDLGRGHWCWWQCTVKSGREGRDIDAVQVGVQVDARVAEIIGMQQQQQQQQRQCSCRGGQHVWTSPTNQWYTLWA